MWGVIALRPETAHQGLPALKLIPTVPKALALLVCPIPVDWIRSQENSKLGWKEIAREVMRRIGVLKELQR